MIRSLRSLRIRDACMLLLGSALIAASFLAARVDRRVHIPAQTLAQSRGRNLGSSLSTGSCDTFNLFLACAANGAPCVTCGSPTYVSVTPDNIGGYYYKGNNTACGIAFAGTCNVALVCVPSGAPVAICVNPTVRVQ